MSKDISGSPWPVTSVLRPPKAQELLCGTLSLLVRHCWYLEDGEPCRPLTAVLKLTSHILLLVTEDAGKTSFKAEGFLVVQW